MTGREVRTTWRGRRVLAWVPDLLADQDLAVTDEPTVRAVERARQHVVAADQHTPAQWEPLARLLLRSEGVASSYIEGVRAPVDDVAVAQVDAHRARGAAGWVAANLAVIDRALRHAYGGRALTVGVLNDWHRDLMAGHGDAQTVGRYRSVQGWIGGASPLDAALVTPPPDAVPDLMHDLLAYANDTAADPVAQAAIAHAQFEIIHPYGDGNGRLGRVLILWVLARRIGVRVLPPVSSRIAADPGGYLAGLTTFRLVAAAPWVRWFADRLTDSAAIVDRTTAALTDLSAQWAMRLDGAGVRSDAAARAVLTHLVRQPVLTARMVSEVLGVSERSARTALDTLAQLSIVERLDNVAPRGRGRQAQWFVAGEVLALVARR